MPRLAPPDEDSFRNALWKNEGWPLLGEPLVKELEPSPDLSASFGENAAPKGFIESDGCCCRLVDGDSLMWL